MVNLDVESSQAVIIHNFVVPELKLNIRQTLQVDRIGQTNVPEALSVVIGSDIGDRSAKSALFAVVNGLHVHLTTVHEDDLEKSGRGDDRSAGILSAVGVPTFFEILTHDSGRPSCDGSRHAGAHHRGEAAFPVPGPRTAIIAFTKGVWKGAGTYDVFTGRDQVRLYAVVRGWATRTKICYVSRSKHSGGQIVAGGMAGTDRDAILKGRGG